MVLRNFKIPKHGGPDGQGLPLEAFLQLLIIFKDVTINDEDAEKSMMLSFSASKQNEWNENYRIELLKFSTHQDKK